MSINSRLLFSHRLAQHPVIIVPGLRNSGGSHWQTLWEESIPHARRIQLTQWEQADLTAWKEGIQRELAQLDQPAILIAHSFGTLASASIAEESPEKIAGLFLVAPADPDKFGIFNALPQRSLSVPASLIASSNDPWLTEQKAAYLALLWGTDYLRFKEVGHINAESQLGIWPEGIQELNKLTRKIPPKVQQEAA